MKKSLERLYLHTYSPLFFSEEKQCSFGPKQITLYIPPTFEENLKYAR